MSEDEVQAFARAVSTSSAEVLRRALVPDLTSFETRRLAWVAQVHEKVRRQLESRRSELGVELLVDTYERQRRQRQKRARPRLGPRCPDWVRMLNRAEELEQDARLLRQGAEVLRLMHDREATNGSR